MNHCEYLTIRGRTTDMEYAVSKYGNDDQKWQAPPVSFFGAKLRLFKHTYTASVIQEYIT